MKNSTVHSEKLPLALQQQIDACCDQFEQALQNGHSPQIDQILEGIPPEGHFALRRELAAIEMAYQRTLQGDHRSDGLHLRCPHCQNQVELLPEAKLEEITCNSCGDTFNLIEDEDVTLADDGPQRVGHFELMECLGTGGFGSVWEARDTELDRLVALKMPRKSQLMAHEAEQFFREARTAAQLKHPNIVPVHEVGKEHGKIFIVTDLIRGQTMSDWLKEFRPSAREIAELCATIADALSYAHSKGVIHRDLKPSNVMLDEQLQPYIMDFGLAKRELGEITMTVDGTVLGTPAYMSPEQAQGKLHWVDRRTDIYSLGVMLFRMLTEELPYRGTAQQQIQQRIVDDAPDPRRLNPHTPDDLATICLKCLEREATKRFVNAEAVADELRRYLAGEPIRSRPISSVNRLFRWAKRNPATATAGTLVCFLAIAGPLAAATIYRDKQTIEAKSYQINQRIQEKIEEVDEKSQQLAEVRGQLESILDAHPGIEELSDWHKRLIDEFVQANSSSREQLFDQSDSSNDAGQLTQAQTHLGWAYLFAVKEDSEQAARHAEAARERFQTLLDADPNSIAHQLKLAESLKQFGLAKQSLGEDEDASRALAESLSIRTELAEQNPTDVKYQLDQFLSTGEQLAVTQTIDENLAKTDALKQWAELKSKLASHLVVDEIDFYKLACYLTQHETHLPLDLDLTPVTTGHSSVDGQVD